MQFDDNNETKTMPSLLKCMYGHHIQQNVDRPGKVANSACGQLNSENEHFPVPIMSIYI